LDDRSGVLFLGCRVFVTSARVVAWHENRGRLAIVLDEPHTSTVQPDRGTLRTTLDLQVADGVVWVNRGSRGCGCGSPLKAISPPVGW
jgi:hypothetical protein